MPLHVLYITSVDVVQNPAVLAHQGALVKKVWLELQQTCAQDPAFAKLLNIEQDHITLICQSCPGRGFYWLTKKNRQALFVDISISRTEPMKSENDVQKGRRIAQVRNIRIFTDRSCCFDQEPLISLAQASREVFASLAKQIGY